MSNKKTRREGKENVWEDYEDKRYYGHDFELRNKYFIHHQLITTTFLLTQGITCQTVRSSNMTSNRDSLSSQKNIAFICIIDRWILHYHAFLTQHIHF